MTATVVVEARNRTVTARDRKNSGQLDRAAAIPDPRLPQFRTPGRSQLN
jgi:hypothetical protein